MHAINVGSYEQARALRLTFSKLPVSIEAMLSFQEECIAAQDQTTISWLSLIEAKYRSSSLTKQFMESFSNLPRQEKAEEYARFVKILGMVVANTAVLPDSLSSSIKQFEAYIKDGIIRRWWHKCLIELDFGKAIATVVGTKDSSIDLHFYLIRKSKNKRKIAFALESTKAQIPRVVKIGFDRLFEYEACYDSFQLALNKATWENIRKAFRESRVESREEAHNAPVQFDVGTFRVSSPNTSESLIPPGNKQWESSIQNPINAPSGNSSDMQRTSRSELSQRRIDANVKESIVWQGRPSFNTFLKKPDRVEKHPLEYKPSVISTQTSLQPPLLERQLSPTYAVPFNASISNIRSHVSSPTARAAVTSPFPLAQLEAQAPQPISPSEAQSRTVSSPSDQLTEKCFDIMDSFLSHANLDPQPSMFSTIRNNATYRIQRHVQRPSCFRLVLNLSKPKEELLPGIVQPANYPLWNQEIIKADTKARIFKHNFTVCKQTHRPWLQGQPATEFLFVRHLCQKDDKVFLVDRSIDADEFPIAEGVRRGNISSCIWNISNAMNSRMTQLSIQLELVLKPPADRSEQNELIVRYLQGLAKLDYFLLKNQKFKTRVSDYFEVEWPLGRRIAPINVMVTNHQSMKIKLPTDLGNVSQREYAQLFSQQLSLIDDDEDAGNVADLNQSFRNGTSIKSKTAIEGTAQDNLNMTPIANLDQSFGEAVSPFFPHAPRLSAERQSVRQQRIQKLQRKFTDELGHELEGEILLLQNSRNVDNKAFSTQLQQMLSTKESVILDSNKRDSLKGPRSSLQEMGRQAVMRQSERAISIPADIQKINASNVVKREGFEKKKIDMKIDPAYLSAHAPQQPIAYTYKPMKGRDKNRSGWKNYIEGYDLRFNEQECLFCTDRQHVSEVQHVFQYMQAKGISNNEYRLNQLPVTVLQPKSLLERMARLLCFAPYYLEKAVAEPSPYERVKLVAALCYVSSLLQIESAVPFPTVLGQTFQGWLYGCPVYCEHVSDSPVTVSLLLVGRGYRVLACLQPQIRATSSIISYKLVGDFRVVFASHSSINYSLAWYQQSGLQEGLTFYQPRGKAFVYDEKDCYFCELDFQQTTRPREVRGKIIQTEASFVSWFMRNPSQRNGAPLGKQLDSLKGIWPNQLLCRDMAIYDINRDQPCELLNELYPLPSDSFYRLDVNYAKSNDTIDAQLEKDKLFEQLKQDQRLRFFALHSRR